MIRVAKYALGFLIFFVCILVFYSVLYYFLEIRPIRSIIEEKISQYSPLTENYLLMETMAVNEESRRGIADFVAHSFAVEVTEKEFRSMWHLRGLHWHIWFRLLYTEKEIFQLWLAMAPYGKGRGIKEASMYHFANIFEKLSCYQIAQLVVMVRSPSGYKPGSERSEKRIYKRGVANVCKS